MRSSMSSTKKRGCVKIDGAVIVITGGLGSLGQAISQHLLSEGATTILLDSESEQSREFLGSEFHHVDLVDNFETSKIFSRIASAHSRIDGLVNCAGLIHSQAFARFSKSGVEMQSLEVFREVIDKNLVTTFNATSACVHEMISRRLSGAITNISSITSVGNSGQVAYSSAKAAVDSLTVSLAGELGPLGIRVNAILPGFIDTVSTRRSLGTDYLDRVSRATPLRRLGEMVSVAQMVRTCFENEFLTGALIKVSGGLRL